MAPQRSAVVRNYFRYNENTVSSQCLCNVNDDPAVNDGIATVEELQCKKILNGSRASNLEYHVKSHHPNTYKKLMKLKNKNISDINRNKAQSQTISNYFTLVAQPTTLSVRYSRQEILRAILLLVTQEGRPFSTLHDESFLMVYGKAMKVLNIKMTRFTVARFIKEAADYIENKMRDLFQKSLLTLKADGASRLQWSFLGLNAQFNVEGVIQIFVMCVKEVFVQQTGFNIKKLIEEELEKFGVPNLKSVLSVTTDNGSNYLKCVRLMNEEAFPNTASSDSQAPDDEEDESMFSIGIDDENSEAQCREMFEEIKKIEEITGIVCAEHELQLAINGALKLNDTTNSYISVYKTIIKRVHAVAIELRTKNIAMELRKRGYKKPVKENDTRWCSTYKMCESVLMLKNFCKEKATVTPIIDKNTAGSPTKQKKKINKPNKNLELTNDEWTALEEIIESLKPSYIATVKLQDSQITLSDVYKIYDMCHTETAKIGTPLSQQLIEHFNERRDKIMKNNLMVSALYLDPRFRFRLSVFEQLDAHEFIRSVYHRILDLKGDEKNESLIKPEQLLVEETVQVQNDMNKSTDADWYEKLLESENEMVIMSENHQDDALTTEIKQYEKLPRLHSSESVLQFWEQQKKIFPLLYSVARIILMVPGTQCSVERTFSALRFILNERREKLSAENINNILFVRANFCHLDDGFFSRTSFF